MLYEAIHKMRLWLAERREKALAHDIRRTGTSEGDWIGANVAASAASSGPGVVSHHGTPACDGGSASYSDSGSAGNC